jgi:hypothetical protein
MAPTDVRSIVVDAREGGPARREAPVGGEPAVAMLDAALPAAHPGPPPGVPELRKEYAPARPDPLPKLLEGTAILFVLLIVAALAERWVRRWTGF